MMSAAFVALSPLLAQISAELKMRLRSFATPVALAAFCAAAFLWIPDPKSNAASLTWEIGGQAQSPVYTAGYLGLSVAILSCIFLPLGGFYLVAGSVRRDRERRVGAILAATPLSKTAYLGGKLAAHIAYLVVLDLFALLMGLAAFLRYGAGPFSLSAFAGPYLVLTVPVLVVVASFAVFFDVTPGLRGRGGLVIWFFFFLFGLVKLPLDLTGADLDPKERTTIGKPVFDPAGIATDVWLLAKTLPKEAKSISSGHVSFDTKKIERVPWKGIAVTPELLAMRAANMALALLPFLLAVLIFDRFDPARGRLRARKPGMGVAARISERFRRRAAIADDAQAGSPDAAVALTPVSARPSALGAVLAEARLIWESASWIKWPLAVAAILAGALPGEVAPAVFLILLVPVIAEVAAREELAGTRALVFSQPAVPSRPILWKCAAVAVFLLALGMPMTVRAFTVSPARGAECAAGLLALAGISVAFGSLTSGGKLFSGVFLAVWYMALSGLPEADVTGVLSKFPTLRVSLAALGLGVLLVTAAAARERLRAVRA
jgi:hypothetical protein